MTPRSRKPVRRSRRHALSSGKVNLHRLSSLRREKGRAKQTFEVGDKAVVTSEGLGRHSRSIPPHAGYSRETMSWRKNLSERVDQPAVVTQVFPGGNLDLEYPDGYVVLVYDYMVTKIDDQRLSSTRLRRAGKSNVDQVRVYVADLEAYNNGKLKGEWLDLPADDAEIQAVLDRHSKNGQHDWAIHDYEAPFSISESADLYALSALLESAEEHDVPLVVLGYLLDYGYGMEQIEPLLEDITVFAGTAEEYVEEYLDSTGMLEQLPEWAQPYIDTERMARDWDLNGDIHEAGGYVISGLH
jgi:antirestriction protein